MKCFTLVTCYIEEHINIKHHKRWKPCNVIFIFYYILSNRITEGLLAANDHFLLAGKNGYAPDCEMLIMSLLEIH